jgi:Tfp pilus assembly protein PilN
MRLDYQSNNPFPLAGALMLGVAIVALALTGTYFYRLNTQIAAYESGVERAKEKRAQRSTQRSSGELAQEVKNANDVLRRLSVPWEPLFQAVESSGDPNITLLAIEPDIEKQQVKISGEAKNYNALMKYITHLQGQPVFGSVYLQNHDVQQQDPDKPVRFSLQAAWQDKS